MLPSIIADRVVNGWQNKPWAARTSSGITARGRSRYDRPWLHPRLRATLALLGAAALLLSACATGPTPAIGSGAAPADPAREQVAATALALRGARYEYGGDGPETFDCSGLVHYAYGEIGVDVPRTAERQYRAVARIAPAELAPGDLVFFRFGAFGIDHVGIYVGDREFVHAPKTGSEVHVSSLEQPFWQQRLIRTGRFDRPTRSTSID